MKCGYLTSQLGRSLSESEIPRPTRAGRSQIGTATREIHTREAATQPREVEFIGTQVVHGHGFDQALHENRLQQDQV
jgi:hypothetical protein